MPSVHPVRAFRARTVVRAAARLLVPAVAAAALSAGSALGVEPGRAVEAQPPTQPPALTTALRSAAADSLGRDDRPAATPAFAAASCPGPETKVSGSGANVAVTIPGFSTVLRPGKIPRSWWVSPPDDDVLFLLYFRGFMWIRKAAQNAASAHDKVALDALVRTVVDSVTYNPDSGKPVRGWDEGTNLRRQQAAECLFRLTGGDRRLLPVIEASAAANLDQTRYYGPPYRMVHNHGLMANLVLLDSAALHRRPEWAAVATRRLVADSSSAWTPTGLSLEQSGFYGMHNISTWQEAVDALVALNDPSLTRPIAAIEKDLARARAAYAHLTDPAGRVAHYGNGAARAGISRSQPTLSLRDDTAGVIAGRWSFTDPRTSWYFLRYGGRRVAHGHEDRGQLLWQTLGVEVLADSGSYGSDPRNMYTAWSRGPVAHNLQVPAGRLFNPTAPVTLTKATRSATAAAFVLTDRQWGQPHTRSWVVDALHRRVTLTDVAASKATTVLHLGPSWSVKTTSRDRKTVVLVTAQRRRLVVVGSAPVLFYRGSTRPVAGWLFPSVQGRKPAVELVMPVPAGKSTVTLTVS